MTVSGTTVFNMDLTEIIEEAFERVGVEIRSGYEARSARRSLALLMQDWANRGLNLWTISEIDLPLIVNQGAYTLGADVVDLIETMVQIPNTSQTTRYNISRVSVSTYATRTNPTITGRPTEIYIDRQQAAPIVHIWPYPDVAGYTLNYWYLRRINDPGAYTNNMDVPFRFLPALIAGLAYYLAVKYLAVDRADTRWAVMFAEQKIIRLKADYEEMFLTASQEDREKATLSITPRGSSYRMH